MTMRAVQFDQYGDVQVLDVRDVPRPQPGPGQVTVAVRAAGINPGEVRIREGALHEMWPATFPEGQGSDFAGVVNEVGDGVTGFDTGDEVFGFTDFRASQAEYVLAEADHIVHKPAGIDWAVAGSLFIVGTSAYALVHAADVGPGDVVVVSAAAGGVGSVTSQWARNTGATVIGLAGPANHAWLDAHGVVPVDYRDGDLADRVRAAAGGRQPTVLLDTYGPPYVQVGLELGIEPQRIASVADFAAQSQGAQLVFHSAVARPEVLTDLADAVVAGRLDVPIAATYPLEQVRDAFLDLQQRHTHGKIVLRP